MELIYIITFVAIVWIVIGIWVYATKVRLAIPPYQAPVCTGDCAQGRNCTCFQQSCDMTVEEYDKRGKPIAAWPFPRNRP
jgi:hypothetical protein